MMKFYLAICKNKFYLYDEARKPVHIDGNPFFDYERNKIREATLELTEKIVDDNNLANKNELKFLVVENSDAVLNESFAKAQGNLIAKKYPLNELLSKTIRELAKNPKLYVNELGVNYDGECYNVENEILTAREYSLLALSIEPKELLNFVD